MRNNYFTKSFLNALEHTSVEVEKPTRYLKARWSVESAKDLRVEFGVGAEEKLAKMMAKNLRDEIWKEIERETNQRYVTGYKGSEVNSEYIYAPYIPVML